MATLDLMIAGAQKSGTSSLLAWLGTHPQILAQRQPEMTWFTDPGVSAGPFPDDFYFDAMPPGQCLRLGKLAGLMYSDEGAGRLRAHSPGALTIAVLRDPVERAYASFWFARRRGREPVGDFDQAVEAGLDRVDGDEDWQESGCRHLDWGCYAPHVQRLYDRLGQGSVHVVIFEDLISDGPRAIAPALDRCGLDVDGLQGWLPRENSGGAARSVALTRARRNSSLAGVARRMLPLATRGVLLSGYRRMNERSGASPPMSLATRKRLETVYAGPNRRLEAVLGRSVEAWGPTDSPPFRSGRV